MNKGFVMKKLLQASEEGAEKQGPVRSKAA